MELKQFITEALRDITDAVKDCQQNVGNGAIFAPTNADGGTVIRAKQGNLTVSSVEFDVAVTASSENTDGISGGGGINVLGMQFGAKGNNEDKVAEATTSRIKFAIPVVYPPTDVEMKPRAKVTW